MSREQRINLIRTIGETIRDNAESIAGTEKLLTRIDISTSIVLDGSYEIPEINITRSFFPDKYFNENIISLKEDLDGLG